MKKLVLIFFAFALMSCVDKDFDLGDVNDDEIVFGDEFVAPIGTLNLKFSDIFGVSGTSSADVTVPDIKVLKMAIGSGFDKGIIDKLTSYGEQSVSVVVDTNLPGVTMNVEVGFSAMEEPVVNSNFDSNNVTYTKKIDKEMLSKIAESNSIVVTLKYVSGDRDITVNLNEGVKIDITLHRKGGIKLN